MYNLRYHIASLVGVFLALALGLILGGLVVQSGTVDRQQDALVTGLRKEFADLRTENRELSDENEQLSAYSEAMTDAWTAGRLSGKATGILTNAGRSDGLKDSTEAVEEAGGTAVVILLPEAGIDLGDPELASLVASVTAGVEPSAATLGEVLRSEWSTPGAPRPLTDALAAAGLVTVEGLDGDGSIDGVVNIAAPEGEPDATAIAIARAFADAGSPALGAQTTSRDTGVARASAAAGLSAFDTLGTDVGRYTLVALLTGATPGYYGTGEGTAALFPVPPAP